MRLTAVAPGGLFVMYRLSRVGQDMMGAALVLFACLGFGQPAFGVATVDNPIADFSVNEDAPPSATIDLQSVFDGNGPFNYAVISNSNPVSGANGADERHARSDVELSAGCERCRDDHRWSDRWRSLEREQHVHGDGQSGKRRTGSVAPGAHRRGRFATRDYACRHRRRRRHADVCGGICRHTER